MTITTSTRSASDGSSLRSAIVRSAKVVGQTSGQLVNPKYTTCTPLGRARKSMSVPGLLSEGRLTRSTCGAGSMTAPDSVSPLPPSDDPPQATSTNVMIVAIATWRNRVFVALNSTPFRSLPRRRWFPSPAIRRSGPEQPNHAGRGPPASESCRSGNQAHLQLRHTANPTPE